MGTKPEFLSGFHRNDTLTPVITITVYLGAEAWDGPRSPVSYTHLGSTLRLISDIEGVKYTEGRFLPYFFPDTFHAVSYTHLLRAFVFPQRRMRRSKHIELEYDINFWQDNKIVFVGK